MAHTVEHVQQHSTPLPLNATSTAAGVAALQAADDAIEEKANVIFKRVMEGMV
jgi:hypothetical protein